MTNNDINFEIADDCPEEIAEQFKNYVEADWFCNHKFN